MVIDSGNNSINSLNGSNSRGRSVATDKSSTSQPGADKVKTQPEMQDSVSLSDTSRALSQLESKVADSSEIDSAKVASLKSAIEEGRYTIDSEAMAKRMLREDALLS